MKNLKKNSFGTLVSKYLNKNKKYMQEIVPREFFLNNFNYLITNLT